MTEVGLVPETRHPPAFPMLHLLISRKGISPCHEVPLLRPGDGGRLDRDRELGLWGQVEEGDQLPLAYRRRRREDIRIQSLGDSAYQGREMPEVPFDRRKILMAFKFTLLGWNGAGGAI